MNTAIEQKLRELWQESLTQNALAVHVVTHLLLANYQNGTHGDFAKWCCQFSTALKLSTSVEGGKQVLPGEFPNDSGGTEWIC
jgi:hypothetical protein